MNPSLLEHLGLTVGESKVYLSLLKLGQTSAGPIVKTAGISRSKVYEILERLQSKGLVSSIIINGVKKFQALDPRLIPIFLEKKKEEINQQVQDFMKIIPTLLAEMKEKTPEQSVEVYSGWNGVKNVFNLLLKEAKRGDVWCAFGIPEVQSKQRARFFRHWREESDRIGIMQRLIANQKIKGSAELAPHSPLSKIRYSSYETPTSVDIFLEYTLLGVWGENPIMVVMKEKQIADSFRLFFEQLWKGAKE